MSENNNVKEVDIKGMISFILKRWRKIVIVAIILTFIVGGYKSYSLIQMKNDSTLNKSWDDSYQTALEKYENDKLTLEKEVSNLESYLKRQNEYNSNSIKMQINPYDIQVAKISYYVNSDYKIMPNMTYQNPDITKSVMSSYITTAQGEMYDYIKNKLSYDIDLKYLKEVINVSADYDNQIIYIKIIYNDLDKCKEIYNLVKDFFNMTYTNVNNIIGEHKLSIVDEAIQSEVDFNLATTQSGYIQSASDYSNALAEKAKALSTLIAPTKFLISNKDIVKSTVKYACFGFVLGIIIAGSIMIVTVFMNGNLLSIRELRTIYKLRILGVITHTENNKTFRFIDRGINYFLGFPKNEASECEAMERAYANLRAVIYNNYDLKPNMKVVFIGSVAEDEITGIVKNIKSYDDKDSFQLICGKDINYSASTIDNVTDCDGVVIIEKIGYSRLAQITNELNYIRDINKNVIGAIILAE